MVLEPKSRRGLTVTIAGEITLGREPDCTISIDDDAYVVISDRKKDVIISGGENVSSIEVEDAIFQHPEVTEVAVIGIPDEKWGEMVTALVVTTPGSTLVEADVIDAARRAGGRDLTQHASRVDRHDRRPRRGTLQQGRVVD